VRLGPDAEHPAAVPDDVPGDPQRLGDPAITEAGLGVEVLVEGHR
jgi:hypothetical protein